MENSDHKRIDARGLACPQPVVLTKRELENADRVTVLVDDPVALENIKRLGETLGCEVHVEQTPAKTYEIHLKKSGQAPSPQKAPGCAPAGGPFVIVFSSDKMGRGEDALGDVLVRAFIHTLCEQDIKPDKIIFYNTGVKLAAAGSETVDDLKRLAEADVELLVCGTCVNYFNLAGKIGAGKISNMYAIAETMSTAGRLVTP